MSPREGVSRKRGVPIGSAWPWSGGSGTVRTGKLARVGAATVGLAAGLELVWKMAEGPRRVRSHSRQKGVSYQLLLLNAGSSELICGLKTASSSGAPESQAR